MKIFVSHASEQRAIAEAIEAALACEGHVVFVDRSDLPSGETYHDRIRDAIGDSHLFIFLVSPESVSPGRYTLTELELAREKWRRPAARVLPVVVKPTDLAMLPPYVKPLTLLEPQGNIPAAVAASVAALSPRWSRVARRWVAVWLTGLVIVGVTAWWVVRDRQLARDVSALLATARVEQHGGNYSQAWDTCDRAAALDPDDRSVVRAREALSMAWLENARVPAGAATFGAIVARVEPVLAACATSEEPQRAADCLAHVGWGRFLRLREGEGGLDPAAAYRGALERDPQNVFAHAMWGFDVLRSHGPIALATSHFDAALASGRERTFVRHLQLAGLLWRRDAAAQDEVVRMANAMRVGREVLTGDDGTHDDRWRIWDVYYDRLVNRYEVESFETALPPPDHLATYEWLFPASEVPSGKRDQHALMLAMLEERAGRRAEALARYRQLHDGMARDGSLRHGGRLPDLTRAAIARLSK